MSKRHQASRRRTYGRRQHEIHERSERPVGAMDMNESDSNTMAGHWAAEPLGRWAADAWLQSRGID